MEDAPSAVSTAENNRLNEAPPSRPYAVRRSRLDTMQCASYAKGLQLTSHPDLPTIALNI